MQKKNKKIKKKGIKSRSVLCDIPGFDIIKSLDVDWMHCVGLGVCRQFAGLWFDSKNSNEEFYFGDRIDVVDNLITSFFPTSTFSRTPRKLSDRVHFKAHEWIIDYLSKSSKPQTKKVLG
ncbi:Protein of unknown function [Cotesia congregata]|uniref:Uncharacterized protein n=1 Tax=Cotesia congregata TaxID=51543 RepID=A0A8J2HK60_COTCN|nr:Protein of unknown function [Cotesia congregata]